MDPYEVLGVARDAAKAEIKQAFRRKAARNHPDRGGDAAAMSDLNHAHRLLTDDSKRAHYDRTGEEQELEDPLTRHARNTLLGILMKVAEAYSQEKFSGDIFAKARAIIQEGLDKAPEARRQMAKVEYMLRKIRKAPAANPLILTALTNQHEGLKEQFRLNVEAAPLMLELLKGYAWEEDPPVDPEVKRAQDMVQALHDAMSRRYKGGYQSF